MVRRLSLGKNNHLTYVSLALNPRYVNENHLFLSIYIHVSGPNSQIMLILIRMAVCIRIQNTPASVAITKTCLYNFDPLKPHFYVVKLGFTGVYIIFLISAQKHNLCFEQKYEKYQNFYLKIFIFLVVKISIYFNRRVFVMLSWMCI